jgi:hypothetical protein
MAGINLEGRAQIVVERERAEVVSTLKDMLEISRRSAEEAGVARQDAGITQSLQTPEQVQEGIQSARQTRMVDITDTEQGKLSSPEPLFEMARQVREEDIQETPLDSDPRATSPRPMLRPESMEKPSQTDTQTTFTEQSTNPAQNLLDRIAFGEGADPSKLKVQEELGIGSTPYDMVYAYGKTLAPSKPVSEMTMREVFEFQTDLINATKGKVKGTSLGTSAVGKYQVLRKSLFGNGTPEDPMENSWADKLGLDENTIFSPEVQEKIGMLALREAGYNSFRSGKKSEEVFHNRISDIWASVAKADGTDKYGQGIHTLKADLQSMYNSILGKE